MLVRVDGEEVSIGACDARVEYGIDEGIVDKSMVIIMSHEGVVIDLFDASGEPAGTCSLLLDDLARMCH